ncbi:hypothetical protein [Mastigocoleus sp. MO_188.B34]|uniref:DUF7219 family protein n=1 Tax=Mastigocoleus sp. MO_188.B34 TaxID=3036635 RepID=UPI00261E6A14|nr:hypothetical protein [Mastigocoleus sp. MO_188.B34]MDJ0693001.1 hypothetical protein [Mastigocoleus sp. MO_188.B34]
MSTKFDFLYPQSSYRGKVQPENLVFDANLQEFAQKVGYICCLESNGKVSGEEAFKEIKILWKQLKESKKLLQVGEHPFQNDEDK